MMEILHTVDALSCTWPESVSHLANPTMSSVPLCHARQHEDGKSDIDCMIMSAG